MVGGLVVVVVVGGTVVVGDKDVDVVVGVVVVDGVPPSEGRFSVSILSAEGASTNNTKNGAAKITTTSQKVLSLIFVLAPCFVWLYTQSISSSADGRSAYMISERRWWKCLYVSRASGGTYGGGRSIRFSIVAEPLKAATNPIRERP